MRSFLFLFVLSIILSFSSSITDGTNQRIPSRSISSEERNCADDQSHSTYEQANENPFSKSDYCSRNAKTMIRRFCFKSGRLGYDNEGGFFGLNTGVCWWNSQFHRKVTYLTYFDPTDATGISDQEFKTILKKISNYEVVKIRKYKSFTELVNDQNFPQRRTMMKKFLQNQMANGSFFRAEWVHGFEGRSNIAQKNPRKAEHQREEQKKEFAEIYRRVRNPDPFKVESVYVLTQQQGINAHSFIIYDAAILKRDQHQDFVIYLQDPDNQEDAQRSVFYFDEESAQWFSEEYYLELQEYREKNIFFSIHPTFPTLRQAIKNKVGINRKHRVYAAGWTIQVQREKDNRKINQAFKNFCKKDLFSE